MTSDVARATASRAAWSTSARPTTRSSRSASTATLLNRLNLDRLNRVGRDEAEPEIRGLIVGAARRRDADRAAQPVRARSAHHRRLQRAVRPRPARGAARRPVDLGHPGQPLRPDLRRARRPARDRPTLVFKDDRHLLRIIERIVSSVGRRIDESSPMVDARLPDGSRVNAIIPPLALDGPVLSIRRFRTDRLGAQDLVERRVADRSRCSSSCRPRSAARLNILVSGGTGAGKTTFLNVLSSFISRPRAHRHHRGRGRTDAAAAARGAARDAAGQHRRQGRGHAAAAGDQRPAHAPRSHRRRRGPRRGSARHAAGHEHRPRRQLDDDSRQQPARRAVPPRHDGGDGQPEHPREGRSASRSPRPSTSSSS